jgi:hypothetical protein
MRPNANENHYHLGVTSMIKLHSDTAADIAELINDIQVSLMMIQDGYTRELWTINMAEAIQDLGDKFGIYLPNYVALEEAL